MARKLATITPLLLPIEQMSPTCVRLEIIAREVGKGYAQPIVYNNAAHMRGVLADLREEAKVHNLEQLAKVAKSLPGQRRGITG